MLSEDKVGNIEALEQKLKLIGQSTHSNETGYWQKLSIYCKNLSADQLNFINNNDKVIETKKVMMEAFNLFLFEKFKDEFILSNVTKPLCDTYINSILEAQEEYSNILASAVRENETLRKKIQELERKQNEKYNPKRT